ncbi:hypothetical protein [uncultured Akkermansia sp.]|uniref:hypothetical protein n=1 Tax=uncultured Akkermansia sp. TaxID=512294 RepID=UPI00265CBBAA|nr:hypothetical protein [uncultured Akkermansia sp.]
MNIYYSYRSYRPGGRLLGTLGCGLAWALFGSGWWSFLLGALLLFLWLPVLLGRPYFLTVTSSSISWGNSISRREIPWELIERIGCTPDHEAEPGLMIELKDGHILDVESACFDSLPPVRQAILQASGSYPFHIAPDLFAAPGLLSE